MISNRFGQHYTLSHSSRILRVTLFLIAVSAMAILVVLMKQAESVAIVPPSMKVGVGEARVESSRPEEAIEVRNSSNFNLKNPKTDYELQTLHAEVASRLEEGMNLAKAVQALRISGFETFTISGNPRRGFHIMSRPPHKFIVAIFVRSDLQDGRVDWFVEKWSVVPSGSNIRE